MQWIWVFHFLYLYLQFLKGPTKFLIGQESFYRKDFQIKNAKGLRLQASCFSPSKPPYKRPYVIYCHCNSGSRIEALKYANQLLKNGFGLCCFDFSGSGCSDGDYVTLGFNESEDLKTIINMLINSGITEEIFLWGRSMGAVTALYYILKNKEINIAGLILDSPYCNLKNLALELAHVSIKLPKFLLNPLINSIDNDIRKKIGFNLSSMNLIHLLEENGSMKIPAFFITSLKDTVVAPYHVEELKKYWGKNSILKYIDLKHYENRGDKLIEECISFMKNNLNTSQTTREKKEKTIANEKPIYIILPLKKMPLAAASRIKMIKK